MGRLSPGRANGSGAQWTTITLFGERHDIITLDAMPAASQMKEGERSFDHCGVMEALLTATTVYELGEHCQGPPPV